jgi:hypothetical protein
MLFHDFLLAAIVTACFSKVCVIMSDGKLLLQRKIMLSRIGFIFKQLTLIEYILTKAKHTLQSASHLVISCTLSADACAHTQSGWETQPGQEDPYR